MKKVELENNFIYRYSLRDTLYAKVEKSIIRSLHLIIDGAIWIQLSRKNDATFDSVKDDIR